MTGIPAGEFYTFSGKSPDFAPFLDFARFSQISRNMLTGTTQFNATIQALNTEWVEFLGTRLQENGQLFHALGECKTLPDAQNAYAKYLEKTLSQYTEEAQRIMRMAQGAVEEAARVAQEPIKAANDPAHPRAA